MVHWHCGHGSRSETAHSRVHRYLAPVACTTIASGFEELLPRANGPGGSNVHMHTLDWHVLYEHLYGRLRLAISRDAIRAGQRLGTKTPSNQQKPS